ncbi:hypothetical protein SSS_06149 [Sarcoptes scabiei]|uniref:Uncharacterized protein n=1 Tax=Sarcoptes scabiei TaxID=52283 RepID=A0A834RKS0_SARSC|nr:hypothetical protein SSS_06149 [Sarcoptes scabiei]
MQVLNNLVICLFFFLSDKIVKRIRMSRLMADKSHSIRPSIYFEDLDLKCLCDLDELAILFNRKLRSKWSKCLGLERIYMPSRSTNNERSQRISNLSPKILKRLKFFLTTTDESLNVYCRLSNSWKACTYHLKEIDCFQTNIDLIRLAKDPKFSPLHNIRSIRNNQIDSRRYSIISERIDDISNMAELYQIRCEKIRLHRELPLNDRASSKENDLFVLMDNEFDDDDDDGDDDGNSYGGKFSSRFSLSFLFDWWNSSPRITDHSLDRNDENEEDCDDNDDDLQYSSISIAHREL